MRLAWGGTALLVLAAGCEPRPTPTRTDRQIRVRPAQETAKAGRYTLRFDMEPNLANYHVSYPPESTGIFSPSVTFDLEPVPERMEDWQLWMEAPRQFGTSGGPGSSQSSFSKGESLDKRIRAMGSYSPTFVEPKEWRGRRADFKGYLVRLRPTTYRARLHGIAAIPPASDAPQERHRFTARTAETVDLGDGVSVRVVPTKLAAGLPVEIRWDPKRVPGAREGEEPKLQNLKSSLGSFGSATIDPEGQFRVYRNLDSGPVTGPLNPPYVDIEFQFGNVEERYPVRFGMKFDWLPVRLEN